jgi:chymotrypsin
MKTFLIFAFAVVAASANVDLDWKNARPIEHYPKFWDDKPAALRPPQSFFEKVERERIVGRIVGGNIATPHQFPYQAGLLLFIPSLGGNALCGGSLVSLERVITAAHCVDGATTANVILGAHFLTQAEPGQVRIGVTAADMRMIPSWDPSLIRDDVAIIRLPAGNVPSASATIVPVRLPTASELTDVFAGEDGVISGWGVFSDAEGISSDVLRFVYDNIMTNTACTIRFPGVIQASNICVSGTNGRGACSGDSGGPLTVQRNGESLLIGVVSFGLALGCERSWPSVFARVTSFNSFFQSNMNTW